MSGGRTGRGRQMADINITPLVDILLVVLVAFMVVADVITPPTATVNALPLTLPQSSASAVTPQKPLRLAVPLTGDVLLDGTPLTEAALTARLVELAKAGPVDLILATDQDVRQARFVRILELVQKAGVSEVAIETIATP